ncbi:MAG: glycosyltransferase [Proteobacteria bacterium]|nr:glycosyltransferase [Pseudomonadota bacterium]MBU1738246.1 glycosyltransferase [Pseudomonadota bacterium]
MEKPIVSIILRTKNEACALEKVLESIFKQRLDLTFEVIVIDSGSTDATLDIARRFKTRIYEIDSTEFSFGFSLNFGIGKAEGGIVICLSGHCIPVDTQWMKRLVAPLLADVDIAATFGRQEPIKGLNPLEEIMLLNQFSPDVYGEIKVVFSNANCAIRKQVLVSHPFDEVAVAAEDFIWARTLPDGLGIQYVHDASVYHSHPLSLEYWSKRFYRDAFFREYIKGVYDLEWQGMIPGYDASGLFVKLLKQLEWGVRGISDMVLYMTKNRYFKQMLLVPVFVALFHFNNWKGGRDGKRKYGGS